MNPISTHALDHSSPALRWGHRTAAWPRAVRLASLAIILISLLAIVRLLPTDQLVNVLSNRVEQLGLWGSVVFAAVYVIAAVLFVPGSALTLAAGAVFGLWWGLATVSLASTTAAGLAFLIGRYAARDSVKQWAARSPKFTAIDRAIGQGGWKIIALLRLSPAVPFSLGNYLFGLTSIRFWPYVITSWMAMLPGTFMYVYLGYAGREGLGAAAGAEGGRSPGQWAMLVVGLLATVAVTVYVTRIARRAIRRQAELDDQASPASARDVEPGRTSSSGRLSTGLLLVLAVILVGGTVYGYSHPALLAGLFGPPQVVPEEVYTDEPGGPTFDHSLFDQVLHRYVSEEGGWVDYQGLIADHAALDQYIASLADAPFDKLRRNEKLVLLINAYNAFTLRLILDYYPVKSIKDIPGSKRWDAARWNVGGHIWSLNQIEHEQIRPHFKEPRIHFALVCAAVGCPPLRQEAYIADQLEGQLQDQTVYAHSHDRWFQYDAEHNTLKLTSLYDWYRGDFEQAAGSILQFAGQYSSALRRALDDDHAPKVQYLDYDWKLNSRQNMP